MRRILLLDVPAPCKLINSNDRMHRMAKAKLAAIWRNAGTLAARGHPPITRRVRIVATIWKPRGGRWDPNNYHDTTKPLVDGLVDAGLLADDDHLHVVGPDHRYGGRGEARIVLAIEEVGPTDG